MARICVIGLWHQGVILSAGFADLGHQVHGVDVNAGVVSSLRAGSPPVYEPKLKSLIRRNIRRRRLSYSTDHREALDGADFAFISIDTPVGPDDESDLTSIFEAAREVGRANRGKIILVITAQVPVGTCESLAAVVRTGNPAGAVGVAYVPEFLRLGKAVDLFRRPDRLVIGADDPVVAEQVADLYRPLGCPTVFTSLRTAEMAKHASNVFLATSISFINEIADLCTEAGADVSQVAKIMKLDRRVGKHSFLDPGLGFAGGTLGREIRALQQLARRYGCGSTLLDAVMAVNRSRPRLVRDRLLRIYGSLQGLQVTIFGLTYKPGTSTLRRSLALEIVRDLTGNGVSIKAFDPLARLEEAENLPPFEFCADPYGAASGSDALVLVTEWPDIRNLDLLRLRQAMRRPVMVDTRNFFDPDLMEHAGFSYYGIGRGSPREEKLL